MGVIRISLAEDRPRTLRDRLGEIARAFYFVRPEGDTVELPGRLGRDWQQAALDAIRELDDLERLRALERAEWRPDPWQPIDTAPKDGKPVDLWAKRWRAADDRFEFRRFPDCRWDKGDSMTNRRPGWAGIDAGWRPVAWMRVPDGPPGELTASMETNGRISIPEPKTTTSS